MYLVGIWYDVICMWYVSWIRQGLVCECQVAQLCIKNNASPVCFQRGLKDNWEGMDRQRPSKSWVSISQRKYSFLMTKLYVNQMYMICIQFVCLQLFIYKTFIKTLVPKGVWETFIKTLVPKGVVETFIQTSVPTSVLKTYIKVWVSQWCV